MRRLLTSVLLAIAAASLSLAAQQQQPTFRTGSETVRVYATVMDKDGRLVTDLTRDKFEVRDDGKPQPISVFDNSPQPIQLIVLLDVSGSMSGNLDMLKRSSRALFKELGPNDVAKLGTFGEKITISPEFTRDTVTLEGALPDQIISTAPTPLWRAADQAMSSFDPASDRRKVVILLTDGHDYDSGFHKRTVSQVEVIDRARAEDVMVYGVGLRSQFMPTTGGGISGMNDAMNASLPDPGLARTAEETGGGYADVLPRDDLAAAFTRIVREMHSQYLLGYAPPKRDGKTHKIEVRVNEKGVEPRARKSYVAPGDKH